MYVKFKNKKTGEIVKLNHITHGKEIKKYRKDKNFKELITL
jgi:hypothetical protein